MCYMTIELIDWHWALCLSLGAIQLIGLWMFLSRSPYGPAVVDHFRRHGWFGLVIPVSFVFGSAFTTTVILAELTSVFRKQN